MAVSGADPGRTGFLSGPGWAAVHADPGPAGLFLAGRAGYLLAEVLVALVLLGVGISGAFLLLMQATGTMHRADRLSRSVPFVAALAEAGPMEPEGTVEVPVGDGSPVRLDWWWEEGALAVHHHLPGAGAPVGRRIPIPWLEDRGVPELEDAPWESGG
jgi:hypothetical protein